VLWLHIVTCKACVSCTVLEYTVEHLLIRRTFDSIHSLFSGDYKTPECYELVMSSKYLFVFLALQPIVVVFSQPDSWL